MSINHPIGAYVKDARNKHNSKNTYEIINTFANDFGDQYHVIEHTGKYKFKRHISVKDVIRVEPTSRTNKTDKIDTDLDSLLNHTGISNYINALNNNNNNESTDLLRYATTARIIATDRLHTTSSTELDF